MVIYLMYINLVIETFHPENNFEEMENLEFPKLSFYTFSVGSAT